MATVWDLLCEHIFLYWTFAWCLCWNSDQHDLKAILRVLTNQMCVTAPCLWFLFPYFPERHFVPLKFLAKLPVMMTLEHLLFFLCHRLLHTSYFYKRIHYLHHRWVHPIAYAAFDAHPLEHLCGNLAPIFVSALFVQTSLLEVQIWTWIATINSILAHAGPQYGEEHDLHHRFHNCNYGLAGFYLDKWCGTYRAPRRKKCNCS